MIVEKWTNTFKNQVGDLLDNNMHLMDLKNSASSQMFNLPYLTKLWIGMEALQIHIPVIEQVPGMLRISKNVKSVELQLVTKNIYGEDWMERQYLMEMMPLSTKDYQQEIQESELRDLKPLCGSSSKSNTYIDFPISILYWNCRELNNMEFLENFMELKRGNKPVVSIIADTRRSYINSR